MGTIQFCVIVLLLYDLLFVVTRQARYALMSNILTVLTIALVILDIYSRVFGGK